MVVVFDICWTTRNLYENETCQEKNACDCVLTLLLIDLVVGLSIKQCLLIDFVI